MNLLIFQSEDLFEIVWISSGIIWGGISTLGLNVVDPQNVLNLTQYCNAPIGH